MKQFIVFAGNYGSGKTELSLNFAMEGAAQGKKTMLLDMDVVNPYFRSSEQKEMLEGAGIRVAAPVFANTEVDVPSLPPDIFAPFDGDWDLSIFDCGGDPVGAAALGQLAPRFRLAGEGVTFYYVLNPTRPLQEDPKDAAEMLLQIQARAGIPVTGLVNNANLARETTQEVILEGLKVAEEVSRLTGIPLAFTAAQEHLADGLPGTVRPVKLFMRPAWLDETR